MALLLILISARISTNSSYGKFNIVLDMLQFLRVIAPRHDVEVRQLM